MVFHIHDDDKHPKKSGAVAPDRNLGPKEVASDRLEVDDRHGRKEAASSLGSKMNSELFASQLTKLRISRGLSLAELAAAVVVSKVALWKWETCKFKPRRKNVAALAHALNVTVEELLTEPATKNLGNVVDLEALSRFIALARRRIAAIAGIEPERVKISVDL